jgi:DNA mismatch endonuclease (patch repair protein)
MADVFTKEKRSQVMSRIRSKNTKPELMLRRELFGRGHRYRIHYKGAPGSPDIAFPGQKLAVFCHGCFWHCHAGCAKTPKSNTDYWIPKLAANVERDARKEQELRDRGWKAMVIWECEIKKDVERAADSVEEALCS